MYLINSNTLKLEWFSADRPLYAILSHTWGPEEVTFDDFGDLSRAEQKSGFAKIKLACEQSLRDGLEYAWVDTCCINKESSSELSEAINSMFKWYQDATVCYAYIEELPDNIRPPVTDPLVFECCKWFSRGWTLQELLAPTSVIFFGSNWNKLGTKEDLSSVLTKVTRIPGDVLTNSKRLDEISVADRMSWAAGRKTTREEDIAYSLMGIFDVNMPMMYGEGSKAFIRLQEEILKQTRDDSLFAWQANQQSASDNPYRGLFASSPEEFSSDVSIKPFNTAIAGGTRILGCGLISLNCIMYQESINRKVLGLRCFRGTDLSKVIGVKVIDIGGNAILRSRPSALVMRPHKNCHGSLGNQRSHDTAPRI